MATTIRNQKLFCLNCGGEQVIPYPIATQIFGAMTKAFNKLHKKCPPTWKQPEADLSQSVEQRMGFWLQKGERGTSAETIFEVISGEKIGLKYIGHPSDPDDFRRCYLLLKDIPEWRSRLSKLKDVSDVWSKLVDNWDTLTDMLEAAMQTKDGNAKKMYDLMREIGC